MHKYPREEDARAFVGVLLSLKENGEVDFFLSISGREFTCETLIYPLGTEFTLRFALGFAGGSDSGSGGLGAIMWQHAGWRRPCGN